MDRRMSCLQRRKAELDAFVKALASGGPEVLERAADGVSHLTPVERCADVERLERESPEPPESAAREVEVARGAVSEADRKSVV